MLFLKQKKSSRSQIRIKEVREGVLILPGDAYRSVIETSSVNFELKSAAEQDAIVEGFREFLNSLPFSLQILIRVRELDVDGYLEGIRQKAKKEKEKVYRTQTENYCEFIRSLVSGNKILARKFYVAIPHEVKNKNGDFSFTLEQVNLDRDIVVKGLEKLGMKARPLDSLEMLNLFYAFYNPGQAKTQELNGQTLRELLGGVI